jgi:phosphoserine phosphatase
MRALLIRLWLVLLLAGCALAPTSDALPSWNDGPVKQALLKFVADTTRAGAPGFVPRAERIAVFDNDGTLWSEQPMYFQLTFALDRVKAMAPAHPEWRTMPPFSAVLAGDSRAVAASGEEGLGRIVMATHTGLTTAEFGKAAADWIATARHPRFDRPYTDLVYQPMLELLNHLRANGFKTYIVSGGEVEFMRAWAERVYGVPPEQVIGTTLVTRWEMRANGAPVLVREPKLAFNDDGPGKPVAIQNVIGRRPLLAFGNSDGDHQMLQWSAAGAGLRLMGLVHHTDAEREWAYDRNSHIGRLDKALDEALAKGWTVVDMKRDWKRIYPFQ